MVRVKAHVTREGAEPLVLLRKLVLIISVKRRALRRDIWIELEQVIQVFVGDVWKRGAHEPC